MKNLLIITSLLATAGLNAGLAQSNLVTHAIRANYMTQPPYWLSPTRSNTTDLTIQEWAQTDESNRVAMASAVVALQMGAGAVPTNLTSQLNSNTAALTVLQGQWGALTDADTNSLVKSPPVAVFNSSWVDLSVTNMVVLGTWTNFANATYFPNGAGTPPAVPMCSDLAITFNGGTNWVSAAGLSPQLGIFAAAAIQPTGTLPLSPGISNITIFVMSRADKFGTTNDMAGQHVRVDQAVDPRDAVNLAQMNAAVAVLPSLTVPLYMNGNPINFSPTWSGSTSNEVLSWKYLGVPQFAFSPAPPLYVGTNYTIQIATSQFTNIAVSIPTNATSGQMPFLVATTNWLEWKWAANYVSISNSYPTAIGTNYQAYFTRSNALANTAFLKIAYAGTNAGTFTINGNLNVTGTGGGGGGSGGLLFCQTNTAVVTNLTGEWALAGSGTGTLTITANHLTPGKTYRVYMGGHWKNGGYEFRLHLGGTNGVVIADSLIDSSQADDEDFELGATFVYRGGAVSNLVCQAVVGYVGQKTSSSFTPTVDNSTNLIICPTVQFQYGTGRVESRILTVEELN